MLRNRLPALKKSYYEAGPSYEAEMKDFYGLLRESWERAIEECLLNGAVMRFRKSVETNRLKKAMAVLKPDDFAAIESAMTRCSAFLRGHDDAAGLNPPLPTPENCEEDFKHFEEWTSTRRKLLN